VLLGAVFMTLGAVGLVHLTDVYMRMSASSKAATLGAAHAIGRAGYRRKSPLWKGTIADELADADGGRKESP
jgi:multisubunit Na+/H+ antiporter MnhG subunit